MHKGVTGIVLHSCKMGNAVMSAVRAIENNSSPIERYILVFTGLVLSPIAIYFLVDSIQIGNFPSDAHKYSSWALLAGAILFSLFVLTRVIVSFAIPRLRERSEDRREARKLRGIADDILRALSFHDDAVRDFPDREFTDVWDGYYNAYRNALQKLRRARTRVKMEKALRELPHLDRVPGIENAIRTAHRDLGGYSFLMSGRPGTFHPLQRARDTLNDLLEKGSLEGMLSLPRYREVPVASAVSRRGRAGSYPDAVAV